MTDREFEKMLLMSDEEDEKPKKKRKGRRSAYKKKKEHMTKAELVKGDNTGYEVENKSMNSLTLNMQFVCRDTWIHIALIYVYLHNDYF